MATESGLRGRKKAQTRQRIADVAAHLFATRGYDQVSMTEVAAAADVSDQTVYNYFPAKHDLVLDMAEEIRLRYRSTVLDRAPGTSPAAALGRLAVEDVDRFRRIDPAEALGQFIVVSVASSSVRRQALHIRDEQTATVAAAIATTDPDLPDTVVHAHAAALISLFQLMTDRMGKAILDAREPGDLADELTPALDVAFGDLDQHFLRLAGQHPAEAAG